jgi:hypothetical protein
MKFVGNVTPLGKLQNVVSKTQGHGRCSNIWMDHINRWQECEIIWTNTG